MLEKDEAGNLDESLRKTIEIEGEEITSWDYQLMTKGKELQDYFFLKPTIDVKEGLRLEANDNGAKFIELYRDLMKFWNLKFPKLIYECNYEKLVNDQENETKKLIKFCNLEWEDNCIDHTKNKGGIKTVSLAQARKPVYKSSVNLYETYIEYLPFLNQLKE